MNSTNDYIHPYGGKDLGDNWDPWVHIGVYFMAIPIIVVNIIGNSLTLRAFATDHQLRASNWNIYIVNLATTDLLTAVVVMPLYLLYTVQELNWTLGEEMCRFTIATELWLQTEADITLIFISYDRMMMIRDGEKYDHREKRKRAVRNLFLSWTISWFIHYPVILSFEKIFPQGKILEHGECHMKYHSGDEIVWFAVLIASIELAYPIILLSTFCSMLMFEIWKRGQHIKTLAEHHSDHILHDKERNLCWCLCFMVGVYVLCWTPFTLSILVAMLCNDCVGAGATNILLWWLWIQTAVNPFHYAHADHRFRVRFQQMLCPCLYGTSTDVYALPSLPTLTIKADSEASATVHGQSIQSISDISSTSIITDPSQVSSIRLPRPCSHVETKSTVTKVPETSQQERENSSQAASPTSLRLRSQHLELTVPGAEHVTRNPSVYYPSHHVMDMVNFERVVQQERSRHVPPDAASKNWRILPCPSTERTVVHQERSRHAPPDAASGHTSPGPSTDF